MGGEDSVRCHPTLLSGIVCRVHGPGFLGKECILYRVQCRPASSASNRFTNQHVCSSAPKSQQTGRTARARTAVCRDHDRSARATRLRQKQDGRQEHAQRSVETTIGALEETGCRLAHHIATRGCTAVGGGNATATALWEASLQPQESGANSGLCHLLSICSWALRGREGKLRHVVPRVGMDYGLNCGGSSDLSPNTLL